MRPVYRARTVIEEMDHILEGDRPVQTFVVNQQEFEEYMNSGKHFKNTDNPNDPYWSYKGVRLEIAG